MIGGILDNLKKLDYPKELYEIIVIADNCTDNTADIARSYDVTVYERFNKELSGKGYALKEVFEEYVFKKNFDAVAVFDADNLVSENYFKENEQ